jgi:ribonuclease E
MRMLMPSHAKQRAALRDRRPLFQRYTGVEAQLDAMFSPTRCTLKSGGYIVINQTEALVAIDVNSGRSTRERNNIEDTALKTNLEAAEEVARQLRLRDLAGLIVIDFIDMEEKRNNRAVEKQAEGCAEERPRPHPGRPHLAFRPAGNVAPAPAHRRARRLDPPCPHCGGTGLHLLLALMCCAHPQRRP